MATCKGKFSELGNQLQAVMVSFVENENIAKLLTYKDKDIDPLTQPTVADPYALINTQIFPQTYKPPTDEQTVYISVFFGKFYKSNNPYFKRGRLYVNISCHRDIWASGGRLRVYDLMHEIDSILNRGDTTGSVSQDWFESATYLPINDLYNSYTLEYQMFDA